MVGGGGLVECQACACLSFGLGWATQFNRIRRRDKDRIYLLRQTGVVGADGIDSAGDGSQFSEAACEHLDRVQSETGSKVI